MAMKRANGTGSVYKLKHKPLRKPYVAMITIGYTDEGKCIRKRLGSYAKANDAWNALAEYHFNPDKYNNQSVTFSDVWALMIKEKERQGVDIKKGKFSAAKAKLTPIWNMPMQDIRLAHIQAIFDAYKHLGRSSHETILKAVSGVYKEAIKNDIVTKNYASMITLPPLVKSTIHKPFTDKEIATLWQHTDDKLVKVLLIYIYTGLRPVELYGIKMSNVHLDKRYMIGGGKTKAGTDRIIPIARCILPFIEEIYKLALNSKSLTLLPSGYIPQRIDRRLGLLCEELGLSEHKRHDTRHTFITMARNQKLDLFTLKEIVGHSHNGDVTSEVYTHKTINQLLDFVDSLPTFCRYSN